MKKLTNTEQLARDAHILNHGHCWLCKLLGRKQTTKTQLHHIAGRGRNHECRENFASLCVNDHRGLQSRIDSELICLALKMAYDPDHFSPNKICELRGRSDTCWTFSDASRTLNVLKTIREILRY